MRPLIRCQPLQGKRDAVPGWIVPGWMLLHIMAADRAGDGNVVSWGEVLVCDPAD
jgi:hypothetical protein